MSPLDRHNQRVNNCRRYMAITLEMGDPPHPSSLRRRCKSDGWGKRGRDATRRSRLRFMRSRMTAWDRARMKKPRVIAANRVPWRVPTFGSAMNLHWAQQNKANP